MRKQKEIDRRVERVIRRAMAGTTNQSFVAWGERWLAGERSLDSTDAALCSFVLPELLAAAAAAHAAAVIRSTHGNSRDHKRALMQLATFCGN